MESNATLSSYVEEHFAQEVDFLQRLVRARSTNPYAADTSPADVPVEAAVASIIMQEMVQVELQGALYGISSQRQNVLCTLTGSGESNKTLILTTHMDTVQASDAYTRDPWEAVIEKGRLYGLGVADAKAQIAAFLYAAHSVRRAGIRLAGNLQLAFVVDEESGASSHYGTHYLLEQGLLHGDAAIVGEPGNRKIAIGHRGLYRFRVRTFGESVHTGTKEWEQKTLGHNAILDMSKITLALSNCNIPHASSIAFPGRRNVLTFPTFIKGGNGFNIVPEECEAYGEVRLMPGTSVQDTRMLIERALTPLCVSYQLDDIVALPAVETPPEAEIIQILAHSVEQSSGVFPRLEGCGPACDGWMFSIRGIPTICGFGVECGGVHGANEWIDLESLRNVTEIYARTIVSYLGGN